MKIPYYEVERGAVGQEAHEGVLQFIKIHQKNIVGCLVVVSIAVLIGMYKVNGTGATWPDASGYANAGALIHDWLLSGDLLRPYEFAKENYCQYPAFNIPYHPPAYPALLGLVFVVSGGVSYVSARLFIALCLGLSGCIFVAILRRLGAGLHVSLASSLLLLTTPEIVHWSRDTMSEIPALLFILFASYLFVVWLETERPLYSWAAFGIAEVAFLSRVTTAGILPAWAIFAMVTGRSRQLLSRHVLSPAILYLLINSAWVVFILGFSRYELIENVALRKVELFSWENVLFYPTQLPAMVGWGILIAGLTGAVYTAYLVKQGKRFPLGLFWICWFLSYYVFQLVLSANEQRYFLFALPSFPGLVACLFSQGDFKVVRQWMAPGLVGLGLVVNVGQLMKLPRGVVGYDAVAKELAGLEKSGNVLLAIREMRDLTFRYRALKPNHHRAMLRADRTLAIRLSEYAGVEPRILANSKEDVLGVIRRGRVRYLVTYVPNEVSRDKRSEEAIFAHHVAESSPQSFRVIGKFPLLIEYGGHGVQNQIFLWEFLGKLPRGNSEIPVIIPTASMEIDCP